MTARWSSWITRQSATTTPATSAGCGRLMGKFSAWQRELLQFVLDYRNAVMKRIRPGATARQIMDEAKDSMQPVFARTKFSKREYEQAARTLVERGGGVFSHPVGLAVHDDGGYASAPLKPGQVFSIDPAIRAPSEN